MKILGIETSCDETAVSVVEGNKKQVKVLSNIVSSQIEIHKKYGGVIPEIAAREHVLNILPVVNEALFKAGIKREDVKKEIDAIAVAHGPGLITSLMSGIETAKSLSFAWGISSIGVNHIEGHIAANFINEGVQEKNIEFPSIVLTVSGGHTMLVLMKGHGKFKMLGETRDDAAGEAFDKAAKMMGLGYPGGSIISLEAEKITNYKLQITNKLQNSNNKNQISFPRPMINSGDFDFSFSGLKTALRYALEKDKDWREKIPDYCFEFQQAIIDVLIKKTIKAGLEFSAKTIMLAGGVSANKELRKQLEAEVLKNNFSFQMPDLKYTTDNAAMIASAGYFKALRGEFVEWKDLKVDCNLGFNSPTDVGEDS